MNDFVKASGHLQIRIPVKSTNIHHEVLKQQKEIEPDHNESTLDYTQTMQTVASVNLGATGNQNLTPKERMLQKKEEEARKRMAELKVAAQQNRATLIETKQRKNDELMESGSKWKDTIPKQRVVPTEQVNKIIEQEAFRKKPEANNVVEYHLAQQPVPQQTMKNTSNFSNSPNKKPSYEDIPIATLKTMKRKQQE